MENSVEYGKQIHVVKHIEATKAEFCEQKQKDLFELTSFYGFSVKKIRLVPRIFVITSTCSFLQGAYEVRVGCVILDKLQHFAFSVLRYSVLLSVIR